jgi:hypothetical protein
VICADVRDQFAARVAHRWIKLSTCHTVDEAPSAKRSSQMCSQGNPGAAHGPLPDRAGDPCDYDFIPAVKHHQVTTALDDGDDSPPVGGDCHPAFQHPTGSQPSRRQGLRPGASSPGRGRAARSTAATYREQHHEHAWRGNRGDHADRLHIDSTQHAEGRFPNVPGVRRDMRSHQRHAFQAISAARRIATELSDPAVRLLARVPVADGQLREDHVDETISNAVKNRLLSAFPDGTFAWVDVLGYGDDPAVEPGDTAVRVFIARGGRPEENWDSKETLDEWAKANGEGDREAAQRAASVHRVGRLRPGHPRASSQAL